MKKLLFLLIASFALMGCNETKKTPKPTKLADTLIEITDTTIYGRCAEAARFTVLLATVDGDTTEFVIPSDSDEDSRVVLGGLYNDDKLAIIAYRNADGENEVRRIINLTTLAGIWVDGDRKINLTEDNGWKILNGQVVVNSDTFSIYDITPDTLTLEDSRGIYNFRRQK
ncbi:MAG: hypothetical protein HUK08_05270 [Bacteroidaceae bacterium]|nr:hypothetical protein [Bacteroidaceae bacterium]